MSHQTKSPKFSDIKKRVAKTLLGLDAIQLNVEKPFTWVSGIQSPIYCNNRLIFSNVEARNTVTNAFVELITESFKDETEIIGGVATGGIPPAALVANAMELPMVYIRQEKKKHGLMKQVEGHFEKGQHVVLLEDHISTGGSSMKAIQGLRDEGLELKALISIMTYGFPEAAMCFDENEVPFHSLCDLDTALDVALEEARISESEKQNILEFRNDRLAWGDNKTHS